MLLFVGRGMLRNPGVAAFQCDRTEFPWVLAGVSYCTGKLVEVLQRAGRYQTPTLKEEEEVSL